MASNGIHLIIITNPLVFMDENYLKETILKDKYSKGEIISICQNEVPIKIIIKFSDEALVDSFMTDFNDKPISDKLDYKLSLSKESKTEEEIKKENENADNNLEQFIFHEDYSNEWKINYTNTPQKSGLLYINEEGKKIGYEAIKYLIAKFSKNALQGKSILNISMPVFMFDKRTFHMAFAYEQSFAPIFLTKAALSKDKIERLKLIAAYLISYLHMSVIQLKPFNPIIGETFQCRIGNIDIYIEQTVNHPITLNVYCKEITGLFIMYGHLITDASAQVNTLYSTRLGKFFIKLKDGTLYRIKSPDIFLKGLSVGDRIFNYFNKSLVEDLTNNLCVYMELNPDEPGFFGSFFKSKKTFPDYLKGKIVDLKDVTVCETGGDHKIKKDAKSLSNIEGEWTSYLKFDDEEYWNIDNTKAFDAFNHKFILPSDGRFRGDLINLINGNQEQSQIEKEKLEVRQRQDRKLRAEYAKKK